MAEYKSKYKGTKIDSLLDQVSTNKENITDLAQQMGGKLSSTEKGTANGVATLGEDGKVPTSQLPCDLSEERFVIGETLFTDGELEDDDTTLVLEGASVEEIDEEQILIINN